MQKLEKIIGYHFKDTSLLALALTHKSYRKDSNNERLEFLGDAVLDLLVGEYLYSEFPDKNEGDLSKMRAALVNEQSFMRFAKAIHLDEFIIISANEESNNRTVFIHSHSRIMHGWRRRCHDKKDLSYRKYWQGCI